MPEPPPGTIYDLLRLFLDKARLQEHEAAGWGQVINLAEQVALFGNAALLIDLHGKDIPS